MERRKQYLDYLIYSSFQGVNRLFVLSFEKKYDGKGNTRSFIPK